MRQHLPSKKVSSVATRFLKGKNGFPETSGNLLRTYFLSKKGFGTLPPSRFTPSAHLQEAKPQKSCIVSTFAWKSRFWYRYRPEGIFRCFLARFWAPPGTYASTATKKGKFIGTGHFFPHCMGFLEIGGGGTGTGVRFSFRCCFCVTSRLLHPVMWHGRILRPRDFGSFVLAAKCRMSNLRNFELRFRGSHRAGTATCTQECPQNDVHATHLFPCCDECGEVSFRQKVCHQKSTTFLTLKISTTSSPRTSGTAFRATI